MTIGSPDNAPSANAISAPSSNGNGRNARNHRTQRWILATLAVLFPLASWTAVSFDFTNSSPFALAGGSPIGKPPTAGSSYRRLISSHPDIMTPDHFRSEFHIPSDLDGRGQTIAIIAPTDYDPKRLEVFDRRFHQPTPPPKSATLPPEAKSARLIVNDETMLDVEWAHVIAPSARIIVLPSNDDQDLGSIQPHPTAVSVSIGSNSPLFAVAQLRLGWPSQWHILDGYPAFVASGDAGPQVSLPAFLPYVTSVGGVSLGPNGIVPWPKSGEGIAHWMVSRPNWEQGVQSPWLSVPDVSWLADYPYFAVYNKGWSAWNGTSIATPMWAALWTLLQQSRVNRHELALTSPPNEVLFQIAKYHPDAFNHLQGHAEWNPLIGLGIPNVPKLIKYIDALPRNGKLSLTLPPEAHPLTGYAWFWRGILVAAFLFVLHGHVSGASVPINKPLDCGNNLGLADFCLRFGDGSDCQRYRSLTLESCLGDVCRRLPRV